MKRSKANRLKANGWEAWRLESRKLEVERLRRWEVRKLGKLKMVVDEGRGTMDDRSSAKGLTTTNRLCGSV